MPEPLDWQLLDRYLAGEASPDEALTDPDWATAIDLLRSDFRTPPASQRDTSVAWSRLQARLSTTPDVSPLPATRPTPKPLPATRPWLRIAATVLVAAGSFATWQFFSTRRTTEPNARTFANEVVTPNGSRQTATLADGSQVTLNAGSRLRWTDSRTGPRDVELDGEAYFVVTHDPARPFRVHARGAVAHDLGTRFTVRAYPELAAVEVVVAGMAGT